MGSFAGKHIALGVTGSIAAYKALPLLRLLQGAGAKVTPLLTTQAQQFVGAPSFAALAGQACLTDPWEQASHGHITHVELAQQVDLLLVAPATAHALAVYVAGMAADGIASLWLSSRAPKLVAPAMETAMWDSPATQHNVQTLRQRGVWVVPPQSGPLASGLVGTGRLADLECIVEYAQRAIRQGPSTSLGQLDGQRVLVTAGPTREAFDPARFISNPSSGRMGLALATAAWRRGAHVELVVGPTEVPMPTTLPAAQVHRVHSNADMLAACLRLLPGCDLLLMAAAPCDVMPAEPPSPTKQRKTDAAILQPQLRPTADILQQLTGAAPSCFAVGFAAETADDLTAAAAKMQQKNLQMIVHNRIGGHQSAFAATDNAATLLIPEAPPQPLPRMAKEALAERILDAVAEARPVSRCQSP